MSEEREWKYILFDPPWENIEKALKQMLFKGFYKYLYEWGFVKMHKNRAKSCAFWQAENTLQIERAAI
ncbi:MAG: hypothetical protein E7260_00315 [Lachnospiraceae bacterium]|nr:hypothetical protein [Lachnospiraceae bacterium]